MKIKVVERSGIKMKDMMQKKSISNGRQCTDDCFVCSTTRRGNCMATCVTYTLKCEADHDGKTFQYDGRTMKNGYARGKEHQYKLNNKHEDSCAMETLSRRTRWSSTKFLHERKPPIQRRRDDATDC